MVPVGDQLTSHFEGSGCQLYFTIDPEIIDVLILEVFFDTEDGQETVAHAAAVFKGQLCTDQADQDVLDRDSLCQFWSLNSLGFAAGGCGA